MPNPNDPEVQSNPEPTESFGDVLSQYEKSHTAKTEDGRKQLVGTVVSVNDEFVFLDIGYKIEGTLPVSLFKDAGETVKPGDKFPVTIKGRGPDGYYELSRFKEKRPTDWTALEEAFATKAIVAGTVTAVVKGGLSVDVGVRAFMPASRSGVRDAAEMEKLVGQEIRCRITKLDVTEEDLVVDRRGVLEEEARAEREKKYSELKEGDSVTGTVRSLTDYGAFVDLGGVDGLLHVSDISWARVNKVADVLSVGQQVETRVLKIDLDKKRISLGMKQLQAHPWEAVADKFKTGERVRGVVTRVVDFGAFVELEPGVEGLIHLSEMSWAKRVNKASDVVKPGETVEAVILGVNTDERRISLGLKQAMGDPWAEVARKFAVGSVVEGTVTSLMKFGAFVQLTEGVEGMIHVSDISAEKRLDHPQDALKVGQSVTAQVLEVDLERRRLKLGMKQLIPTSIEEYIAERKVGDTVTGRVVDVNGDQARVELGEGVIAACKIKPEEAAKQESASTAKVDLSSLSSMLQSRWKGTSSEGASKPEPLSAGQIRSFRVVALVPAAKKIELELKK